jgi:branched-subunit amino acid transport protein
MWLVIAGMTLVTLVPRVTPLLLLPGKKMPEIVGRWLSLIAPAILAALLSPDLLLDRDSGPAALNLSFSNTYLLAAVPAFLVAWRTRSLFGTVVTGMAAAALLRLLG